MKLMDVVRAIMDLTRLAREEAMHRMWQAHYDGRAEVCVTHLEKAEFVADLLARRGLTTMLEPAESSRSHQEPTLPPAAFRLPPVMTWRFTSLVQRLIRNIVNSMSTVR